jgi:hypothetical protein
LKRLFFAFAMQSITAHRKTVENNQLNTLANNSLCNHSKLIELGVARCVIAPSPANEIAWVGLNPDEVSASSGPLT